jgi:hypothetical protein
MRTRKIQEVFIMRTAYRFSLGLLGLLGMAVLAKAQVVSAPANFKTPNQPRPAYSFDPAANIPGQQVGYKIKHITNGFAADRAGFKNTDVIIQVNGKPFHNEGEFNSLLRASSVSTKITYFEGNTGMVKMKEVRHIFARLGIEGDMVPLSAPVAPPMPALPPGPVGLPPGAILAPVNPGTGLPG